VVYGRRGIWPSLRGEGFRIMVIRQPSKLRTWVRFLQPLGGRQAFLGFSGNAG
jgi:hypothetical protein